MTIALSIERGGQTLFAGQVRTDQIQRSLAELVAYLGRSNTYPDGAVLLTGTGVVPPAEFTLARGDIADRDRWHWRAGEPGKGGVTVQITAIETLQWGAYPRLMVVRVHTDSGLIGLGETVDKIPAARAALHGTLAPLLLGQDPLDIEGLWRFAHRQPDVSRFRGGETRALSAIELALWDILGKHYGAPLVHLLGGKVRDAIRPTTLASARRKYPTTTPGTMTGGWPGRCWMTAFTP